MNLPDHAAGSRTQGAARLNDSGRWPRLVLPHTERASVRTPPPPEVAAMIEVGELLRSASSPRDVFARLVDIVGRVLPSRAIALASAPTKNDPLVWTNGSSGIDPLHVAAVAETMLDYFHTDAELDDIE